MLQTKRVLQDLESGKVKSFSSQNIPLTSACDVTEAVFGGRDLDYTCDDFCLIL